MSVVPAGMAVSNWSGRPLVSRLMSTKLLKLKAKAEMSSGVSGLRMSGKVMRQKLVQGPAPGDLSVGLLAHQLHGPPVAYQPIGSVEQV